MTASIAPRPAGAVTRGRLTDVERAERAVKEADLQRQVTDLASVLGWSWVHFRAGLRANGRWQVAVEGPLGKGWPDLVLVRERDRRLIFAELKRELEQPSDDQAAVLEALGAAAGLDLRGLTDGPHVQTFVWRPSDLRDPIESSRIYEALR
jgi:hypothetical protein